MDMSMKKARKLRDPTMPFRAWARKHVRRSLLANPTGKLEHICTGPHKSE